MWRWSACCGGIGDEVVMPSSNTQDAQSAACSAITALDTTSLEDPISKWYGVTLPIGYQLADKPVFLLKPHSTESRICFPIGTVYSKQNGAVHKEARTEYILVKDLSKGTYWIMLERMTGKSSWWYPGGNMMWSLGSRFACAELRSAWPAEGHRELELAYLLNFRIGGVELSSSGLLEPGLLEDEFDEDEYHRLASKHETELYKLRRPPEYALINDSVLPLMRLLGLRTRAEASRFVQRHRDGNEWLAEVTISGLFHEASQLSIEHAASYGFKLFQSKLKHFLDICISVECGRKKSYQMTLYPRQEFYYITGHDDDDDDADRRCFRARCSGPSSTPCFRPCSAHVLPPPFIDHTFSDMTAVNLVGDDPRTHIIMPLGTLQIGKKETPFMLVKDVSGDTKKYIILFNARHECYMEKETACDEPEIVPPAKRKARIRGNDEPFTAMEVDFVGINEDGQVSFSQTGMYKEGYHVGPVAVVDDNLIHPGDLAAVEGQAVWSSGRWSCPPAEEPLSEDDLEEDEWLE
ncbi:hypothetical protein LTR95_004220 [Oleoguttula sp. CCFEE 5521]